MLQPYRLYQESNKQFKIQIINQERNLDDNAKKKYTRKSGPTLYMKMHKENRGNHLLKTVILKLSFKDISPNYILPSILLSVAFSVLLQFPDVTTSSCFKHFSNIKHNSNNSIANLEEPLQIFE